MATIFSREEKILKDAQEILKTAQIDTEKDKIMYENLMLEYNNLLNQMKRVIKISDKIEGQLSNALHTIDEMSKMDYLTNIYNRRCFDELLGKVWKNAGSNRETISALMIDVDKFKVFNDIYGHIEGDNLLQRIAETIKNVLEEKKNIVARYGGEEFVVIMPDTNILKAKILGEKVRRSVKKLDIQQNGENGNVTISIGIASNEDRNITSCKELIDSADKALYRAKRLGRNRVEIWNSDFGEVE